MKVSVWQIATVELRRSAIMLIRYPFGAIVTVVLLALLFAGLYETASGFGATFVDGGIFGAELAIQKFAIWTAMISGLGSVAGSVKNDTQSGLIEQIWMAPVNPTLIFFVRALFASTVVLITSVTLSVVLGFVYGVDGIFDRWFFMSLLHASVCSIGLGLALGGASVVFKEIGSLENLVQFLLLPAFLGTSLSNLAFAPWLVPGLLAVEINSCNSCTLGTVGLFFSQALFWLFLGSAVFYLSVKVSKRKGLVYIY